MEGVAPPLKFLTTLRAGIERGESLRASTQKYLQNENDELARLVATWVAIRDQGHQPLVLLDRVQSPQRRAVLMLWDRGLSGESIHQHLLRLEGEIVDASNAEIDSFIGLLPMKMLLPLLFFQFPAFLLLLFGPLLLQFIRQV